MKKIVIGKGVQVKGRFDVRNDLTIEGEDRETSVIYGTDDLRYSHNRGDVYGVQWDTPGLIPQSMSPARLLCMLII